MAGRTKSGSIFINENLIAYRRSLMNRALRMKKNGEIASVWSLDGKIYVKSGLLDRPKQILNDEDLEYV